eukprot:m.8797 g.8797  ORF g.8797 m.8797 type:complete len:184 (+) comp20859_c0_seq1:837-1388(+)
MRFYNTGPTESGQITIDDVNKEIVYFTRYNDEVKEDSYVAAGCECVKQYLSSCGGKLQNAIVRVKDSKGRYRVNFCTNPCNQSARIHVAEPNGVTCLNDLSTDRSDSSLADSLGMALLGAMATPRRTEVRTATRMEMRHVETPFGSATSLRVSQVREVRRERSPLEQLMAGLAIASMLDDDSD